MAKAALRGNSIFFDHDDFARAVNLSSVSSITVTELPPITDGELRLGKVAVQKGQTIRGSNLSLLSYVPGTAQIANSSFRFTVESSPVEIPCHLYLLEKSNASPTPAAMMLSPTRMPCFWAGESFITLITRRDLHSAPFI